MTTPPAGHPFPAGGEEPPAGAAGGGAPAQPGETRTSTGDRSIDEALAGLHDAMSGSATDRLAAAERVHQVLQARLADAVGD